VKEFYKVETILIPREVKHWIENKKLEKLDFIDVQTGVYFRDDIVRIEDDYKRE
jgi:mannose-6-phosphate isomerase-like protein (cupin superfamily)